MGSVWPIDGRGRGLPARSTDAWSEQDFSERIIDTVVRARLNMDAGYPFPELDQEKGRLYHGTFLANFSFFAWSFPSWLMAIADRCPYQDVRRTIIEDCVDEEVGDIDAGGRCHIDVLYDEVEACGIPREVVASMETSPIVIACIHGLENLARSFSWEVSFAAMSALELGSTQQSVELRQKIMSETLTEEQIAAGRTTRDSQSLADRTGLPPEQLAFAALHAYKDQFHGGGELALLTKYGNTLEKQQEMLWAIRTSIQIFVTMREGLEVLARQAVGLPVGERIKVAGSI